MPSSRSFAARTRLALAAERAASWASRTTGRGSGEVIGGKVALRLDPSLLAVLSKGRPVACVSATNGKTTTTRMLAAGVGAETSNSAGANMTAGVAAALSRPPFDGPAVLEVDEIYLPPVARSVAPAVVALLNISRDQLDRSNETRRIASLWRDLGGELPQAVVVANADDPLVAWAAMGWASVVWVGAGQVWTADAMVCPECAQLLSRSAGDWWCDGCGLRRPTPSVSVADLHGIEVDGVRLQVDLTLPGRCNVANAAVAVAAARVMGVAPSESLPRIAAVGSVQGRYEVRELAPGRRGRLLLAKNPAGWLEMLELLDAEPSRPCLIAFNSRTADGRDPSWLWDVPFERLAGREVVVCGERAADVGVRLDYAGVAHRLVPTVLEAALGMSSPDFDVVANYTAFRDLL